MNRELFLKADTTAQLVGRIVIGQVEPVGVPAFLLATLTHICDHQPVTPSAVAALAGVPMTTLRDNIRRLVDRGLVERRPNPRDGRSYYLVVTKRGAEVLEAVSDALLLAYERLEEQLGGPLAEHERRLDELNAALALVLAELEGETGHGATDAVDRPAVVGR